MDRKGICDDCHLTFASRFELKKHLYFTHDSGDGFDPPYSSEKSLIHYARSVRDHPISKDDLKAFESQDMDIFQCLECGFNVANSTYEVHILKSHPEVDGYFCNECDYWSSVPENLAVHFEIAHGKVVVMKDVLSGYKRCSQSHFENQKTNGEESLAYNPHIDQDSDIKLVPIRAKNKVAQKPGQFECQECHLNFGSGSDLHEHSESKHGDFNGFLCTFCGQKAGMSSTLKKHFWVAHMILEDLSYEDFKKEYGYIKRDDQDKLAPVFGCHLCPRLVKTKTNLKQHVLATHTAFGGFKCQHCAQKFKWIKSLSKHESKEHGYVFRFRFDEALKRQEAGKFLQPFEHMWNYEHDCKSGAILDETTPKKTKSVCGVCKRKLVNDNLLKQHVLAEHTNFTGFQCPHCQCKFKFINLLSKHLKANHEENATSLSFEKTIRMNGGVEFLKEFEYMWIKQEVQMKVEQVVAKEPPATVKKMTCTICKVGLRSVHSLKQHVLAKHTEFKGFKCKSCSSRFQFFSSFSKHLRLYHQQTERLHFEETVIANGGSKFLKRFEDMRTELRKLDANKPKNCACSLCKIPVKNTGNLKQHVLAKHTDFEGFQCSKCPSKFKYLVSLSKHLREEHEEIKTLAFEKEVNANGALTFLEPFSYMWSPPDRKNLPKQVLAKVKTMPFNCSQCKVGFSDHKSLVKHNNEFHVEEIKDKFMGETTCSLCNKYYAKRKGLQTHFKKHHTRQEWCDHWKDVNENVDDEEVKAYICKLCKSRTILYFGITSLTTHITRFHSADMKEYVARNPNFAVM